MMDVEPKWFALHRLIHASMNVPGQWEPVSDVEAPATYADNAFYASLRWRDRDILNMLDKVSPFERTCEGGGC